MHYTIRVLYNAKNADSNPHQDTARVFLSPSTLSDSLLPTGPWHRPTSPHCNPSRDCTEYTSSSDTPDSPAALESEGEGGMSADSDAASIVGGRWASFSLLSLLSRVISYQWAGSHADPVIPFDGWFPCLS